MYGAGGGTGSGISGVVAKIIKEIDQKALILSLAVLPAPEECRLRSYNAVINLAFTSEFVDGMGLTSLEDYRGVGESIDEAYDRIDALLGRFFVTMLGSEELPVIKSRVRRAALACLEAVEDRLGGVLA